MSYKQAIIVRKDLGLGAGKTAAQVAHASVGAMKKAGERAADEWESEGSKKVVLKVDGIAELMELKKKAGERKLPVFLVRDAGLTQVEAGTVTCLGIGPAEEGRIDELTSGLKLL
ncbi:MAG: peptidyl-tRNA hydrolase Pth2 [Candidatus Aenigmarchaeota archaeon]|nr:peptidyl-tRNA hydrolase Pth2 [Candidatus Aenigmarchaeota archaeon]